jgi:hypothetical protein
VINAPARFLTGSCSTRSVSRLKASSQISSECTAAASAPWSPMAWETGTWMRNRYAPEPGLSTLKVTLSLCWINAGEAAPMPYSASARLATSTKGICSLSMHRHFDTLAEERPVRLPSRPPLPDCHRHRHQNSCNGRHAVFRDLADARQFDHLSSRVRTSASGSIHVADVASRRLSASWKLVVSLLQRFAPRYRDPFPYSRNASGIRPRCQGHAPTVRFRIWKKNTASPKATSATQRRTSTLPNCCPDSSASGVDS